MPLIRLSVNQDQIEINQRRVRKAAEAILKGLGFTDAELSLVFVDDDEMVRLNSHYRQVSHTTDVLAFPMLEGDFGDIVPELLGDIVISAPTALAISQRCQCALSTVLDLLLVHGILHLVGYDHENTMEDSRQMEDKSVELLRMLGHSRESLDWYLKSGEQGVGSRE
jgi:probable rRNA maturation factor